MRNEDVVRAWLDHKPAKSYNGSLQSTGCNLFSYSVAIGGSVKNNRKVVFTFKVGKFSVATTKHINLAFRLLMQSYNIV